MKLIESAFDWVKVPDNLSKSNLLLVTAKTTSPTLHPNDPKYKKRIFKEDEL